MDAVNQKVEALDINQQSLPASHDLHKGCEMVALTDDEDEDLEWNSDMESEDGDPKPKREVYQVEVAMERDGVFRLVRFPIHYCSTFEVGDIRAQAARYLGLEPTSFKLFYTDAQKRTVYLLFPENLEEALSVVDSESESEPGSGSSSGSGSNILRLGVDLKADFPCYRA